MVKFKHRVVEGRVSGLSRWDHRGILLRYHASRRIHALYLVQCIRYPNHSRDEPRLMPTRAASWCACAWRFSTSATRARELYCPRLPTATDHVQFQSLCYSHVLRSQFESYQSASQQGQRTQSPNWLLTAFSFFSILRTLIFINHCTCVDYINLA